jgi:hypothetical protein
MDEEIERMEIFIQKGMKFRLGFGETNEKKGSSKKTKSERENSVSVFRVCKTGAARDGQEDEEEEQARAGILLLFFCDFTEELERAWVGNIVSLKNACRNPTPTSDLVLCSLLENSKTESTAC